MTVIDLAKQWVGYFVKGFPELGILPWSPNGAYAATGNAWQENLCKPVTTGALDHNSQGGFQWRDSSSTAKRLTGDPRKGDKNWGMQPWCLVHFGTWQTIEAQAAFCMYECARDYVWLDQQLRLGTRKLETLTLDFQDIFEKPSSIYANPGWLPGTMPKGTKPGRINFAYATKEAYEKTPIIAKPVVQSATVGVGGAIVGAAILKWMQSIAVSGDTAQYFLVFAMALVAIFCLAWLVHRLPDKKPPLPVPVEPGAPQMPTDMAPPPATVDSTAPLSLPVTIAVEPIGDLVAELDRLRTAEAAATKARIAQEKKIDDEIARLSNARKPMEPS